MPYAVRSILTMKYYLIFLNQKLLFEMMASLQLGNVHFVTMYSGDAIKFSTLFLTVPIIDSQIGKLIWVTEKNAQS